MGHSDCKLTYKLIIRKFCKEEAWNLHLYPIFRLMELVCVYMCIMQSDLSMRCIKSKFSGNKCAISDHI